MIAHRGSVRWWLQQVGYLKLPGGVYPWHPKWRFRKPADVRWATQLVARLREIADGLEKAVGLEP